MQISLFVCNAEKNRVDKSDFLQNRLPLNGVFKKNTSYKNVVVEIQRDNNMLDYSYNYMYIDATKRWYFINDIIIVSNNRWEIHASVDVLFSYKSDILQSMGIIDKYENEAQSNVYYDDGSIIMDTRDNIEVKQFSNGFNENGSYILICAGGS